jgi:maleylacetate reductase
VSAFRFGAGAIAQTGQVAAELGMERLVLVTSRRWAELADALPVVAVYDGVRSHTPVETIPAAADAVDGAVADGIVALGGGSAIDTAKAATVELIGRGREVRTIAIPTTYAGAEWAPWFGMRDEAAGLKRGGSDQRATPVAAIYDPELTLGLPRDLTGGTAMNALAHCVEALYVEGRRDSAERHAYCGARTISYALPLVLADGTDLYARSRLLEGAMRAARALGAAGLALGHAMAQALGGRYGLAHGALNAIVLPSAMRFNEPVIGEALDVLGEAFGVADPIGRVTELAALTGNTRLRDLGVPAEELDEVAERVAVRPGAKANPRKATSAQIAGLLREAW